nr:SDR family oxidoreductase [Pseudomonas sp.]
MSISISLENKVALVTGAGGGIGSAVARCLAQAGAHLALADMHQDRLDAVAAQLRAESRNEHMRVESLTCDVCRADDVAASVAEFARRLGGVDILVNVAGGGTPQTINTLTSEDWHAVLDLNLTGPFNCIQAVAPHMKARGGGMIVTVASLAAITMSLNNGISYTAAKSGVLGLTRHSAFELASDGIRVNAVLPGPTLTSQIQAKMSPERIDAVANGVPLGRWVLPEEIARSILFFCSDLSSACTGTHFIVDSGMHIGAPVSRDEYFRFRDRAQAAQ